MARRPRPRPVSPGAHSALSRGPSVACRAAGRPDHLIRDPRRHRTTPTCPPRCRCCPGCRHPAVLRRRALDYTGAHTHTPPTGPPQTTACARTDDASRLEGVTARGLGAGGCQTGANLVLARLAVRRPLGVPRGAPEPSLGAKRCGRRPIDLNPPNLKRSTPGRVYR